MMLFSKAVTIQDVRSYVIVTFFELSSRQSALLRFYFPRQKLQYFVSLQIQEMVLLIKKQCESKKVEVDWELFLPNKNLKALEDFMKKNKQFVRENIDLFVDKSNLVLDFFQQ